MIGKAKAISHGINDLSYIMGESKNKKHPEKINHICSQHLPAGLDATGVWESMQASLAGYDNLKNSLIRIELCPPKEHTAHFTFLDWKDLWQEFVEEFDKQAIKDKKGKVRSKPTNLAGSKGVVYLHQESKGGVPHLHGGICRVDEDGNVNNDHDIHLRAQRAAEAVARRRGWTTAMNVRASNVGHVQSVCEAILKDMPQWSWDDYVASIEKKGYQVKTRTDSKGNVKGYTIISGKAKYKASELGEGRTLTYSRLAATWRSFHPVTASQPVRPVTVTPPRKTTQPVARPTAPPVTRPSAPPIARPTAKVDYSEWTPSRNPVDIDVNGTNHHLYLPKNVLRLFDNEFDYRVVENWEPLTNLARAYFAALLSPDTTVSSVGGPSDNSGWGRDKDEDDLEFARRCALMAKSKFGLKKKSNGLHK